MWMCETDAAVYYLLCTLDILDIDAITAFRLLQWILPAKSYGPLHALLHCNPILYSYRAVYLFLSCVFIFSRSS